jgi:hypothetical protein
VGLWPARGTEGFYGTTFGITGSASGAFLLGWRSSDFEQTRRGSVLCFDIGCDGPTESISDSANAHRSRFVGVGNLAGSLGLGWRPTQTVTFEAGYRVDWWLNIGESFNFANDKAFSGTFDQKKDILIHGPFVKATIIY